MMAKSDIPMIPYLKKGEFKLKEQNQLFCGENTEVLSGMPDNLVDLIYIDPPFFSQRNYELIWGDEAEIRSFEDRWDGGIQVYIDWMRDRILHLHRVLKPTGSIYLHCDWHASHYLKVMLDEIFGPRNFLNEIIWHYTGGGRSKTTFSRKHDTIFLYSKSDSHTFNTDAIRVPYKDTSGYAKTGIVAKSGKRYMPNPEGTLMDDVWDIPIINPMAKERTGYPTQKPEKLLERIIKASSNEGDIILDAFCGCGTALVVAQKLNRRWLGIDISPSAIVLVSSRLGKIEALGPGIEISGLPGTMRELQRMTPYDFQYWAINRMLGAPSPRKSGDMGIDGLSCLNNYPIQVKQNSAGRNVVDNFAQALRRHYQNSKRPVAGFIVALDFTKGAKEEVVRTRNKDKIYIELINIEDVLTGKFNTTQKIVDDDDQTTILSTTQKVNMRKV